MNAGLFADCYRPTQSGVVTAVVQLKAGLERRDHKVVVMTVANPPYAEEDAAVFCFPSLAFSRDNGWRLGIAQQRRLNRLVEREALDIIHTHTEFGLGWAGRRAARALGLPWVHTAHTLYEEYRHYLLFGRWLPRGAVRLYLGWFLSGCDALICPSGKSLRYLTGLAPGVRTVVVGNAADGDRFGPGRLSGQEREQVRSGLGLGLSDRVILYAGRLGREKRVVELLYALAPLLSGDARCKALFAGGGPLREALLGAAKRLGVERQVILAGPVPWEDMPAVYAAADLFVTASLSENHPMTCLEAMACGLPIVARRDEGTAGLVQDGATGYLAGSDPEIAERARNLLEDEAKRRAFAENAAAWAGMFSVEMHVDRIEGVYREVVAGGGRRV